jgi:hypothetical protein
MLHPSILNIIKKHTSINGKKHLITTMSSANMSDFAIIDVVFVRPPCPRPRPQPESWVLVDDIYCSAQDDQCSLIIRTFLAAWRGGCGPAS